MKRPIIITAIAAAVLATGAAAAAQVSGEAPAEQAVVVRGDAKDHTSYGQITVTAHTRTPPMVKTPQLW